jgi:hypothetical protein
MCHNVLGIRFFNQKDDFSYCQSLFTYKSPYFHTESPFQRISKVVRDMVLLGSTILLMEKLTYGHDKTNFGTEQGDFMGQEKSILGLFKMNYGT